jgi:LPS-assembly lipoprotein
MRARMRVTCLPAAGLRVAVCVAAMLLLGACGFHLRGVQPGVAGLVVYLDSQTPFGEFEQVLAESIRQADIVISDSVDQAGYIVQLRGERLTRRVQTVNTTGRASDYELILTVEYALAAPTAITDSSTRELDSRREYNFDNTELLGKAEEEALLVQEMRRDIAARLLRQLAYQAAGPG